MPAQGLNTWKYEEQWPSGRVLDLRYFVYASDVDPFEPLRCKVSAPR